MRYCQNCGSPLKDDEVFCTQCGTKAETGQEAEQPGKVKPGQSGQKKDRKWIILLLILLLLIIFAILGFWVSGNNTEAKLRRQISLGDRYYSELDYDRAIAAYSESLKIDPKNEEALIGIAHSYEDRGTERLQEEAGSEEGYNDLLAAVDYYKQAEEYHPDSASLPEIQQGIQRSEKAAASYSGNRDGTSEGTTGTIALEQAEEPPVLEVGDTYIFGTYEQDNDTSNGAEDIEWIVLDKDGDKVLLISKYVLDNQPYNTEVSDVTWETCSLREWLNGTFIDSAFSADDAAKIVTSTVSADGNPEHSTDSGNDTEDRMFLLSISEAEAYFGSPEERTCGPTQYAIEQGTFANSDGFCFWWLRTPGSVSYSAAPVDKDGSIHKLGNVVARDDGGVRPAFWMTVTGQKKEEQSVPEVGGTYTFGAYEQDNDSSDGAEAIEWIVLDKDGDKALLISKYVLECRPYNTSKDVDVWEKCSLREWLNGPFIDSAFSADDAAKIVTSTVTPDGSADLGYETMDKVFLLGASEANTYFKSSEEKTCKPTEFARAQGINTSSVNGCCNWWLRARGNFTLSAAYVEIEGRVNEDGIAVDCSTFGVRPVFWIEP